jgi:hypothetical protein
VGIILSTIPLYCAWLSIVPIQATPISLVYNFSPVSLSRCEEKRENNSVLSVCFEEGERSQITEFGSLFISELFITGGRAKLANACRNFPRMAHLSCTSPRWEKGKLLILCASAADSGSTAECSTRNALAIPSSCSSFLCVLWGFPAVSCSLSSPPPLQLC